MGDTKDSGGPNRAVEGVEGKGRPYTGWSDPYEELRRIAEREKVDTIRVHRALEEIYIYRRRGTENLKPQMTPDETERLIAVVEALIVWNGELLLQRRLLAAAIAPPRRRDGDR